MKDKETITRPYWNEYFTRLDSLLEADKSGDVDYLYKRVAEVMDRKYSPKDLVDKLKDEDLK